jgi:hypothetical protein
LYKKIKIYRPFKNGEMTDAKKSRARSVLCGCAVWIFSLTQQIAVLGRPAKNLWN